MNELFERENAQDGAEESNPLKGLDYRRYVLALIRKWRFITIGFLLFCILGVMAGISLRGKVFNASAVLMYTNPFQGKGSVEGQSYTLSEIDLSTLISTVKLPKNIEKVIKKLNLNVPAVEFSGRIDIRVQRGSDIIAIEGKGSSPREAADIANLTVDAFLSSHSDMRKEEAQKALDRFDDKLTNLEAQLATITDSMDANRKKNGISNLATETEFYLARKTELTSDLDQRRSTLRELESQIVEAEKKLGQRPKAAVGNNLPQRSRQRHKEIVGELARLKALYTNDHPRIVQLEEELRSIRNQKDGQAGAFSSSKIRMKLAAMQSDRDSAKSNIRILEDSLAHLSVKMESLSSAEKSYSGLDEKKQMIKASIVKLSAAKQDATSFLKQLPVEFRVLERAQPPQYASSSKAKIVAIAIPFLGIFVLLMMVLVGEFRDGTIKTSKELIDGFGLKVLAVHPHHPGFREKQETVIESGPYEILVSSLYANDMLKKYKTVGIASVLPQSGQSTIAENISKVLGRRGKSVILVRQSGKLKSKNKGPDMRRNRSEASETEDYRLVEFESLGQLLQKFSDFDKQTSTAKTTTPPPPRTNVPDYVSPKKTLPFNWLPAKIAGGTSSGGFADVGSSRATDHGSYAQSQKKISFDHIVIDPLSLYAEPKAIELFSEIDISIVAVRAGKTRKKHLKSLIEQLENLDTHLAGVILMDADLCFCDEQIRMSVGERPVTYGRDAVERYLTKKFLVS